MKKFIFCLIALLSMSNVLAQNDPSYEDACDFIDNYLAGPMSGAVDSRYGLEFTPKGDMRILVIYVNFSEASESPIYELPYWLATDPYPDSHIDANGDITWGYNDYSEFQSLPLGPPSDNVTKNLSESIYQMSNGQFRVIFESLKDPISNEAVGIEVDLSSLFSGPSQNAAGNQNIINRNVFEQINDLYPNYDWSRFDQRKSFPNFKNDYSGVDPDLDIDYVIIQYRNNGSWGQDLLPGVYLGGGGVNQIITGANSNPFIFDNGSNPSGFYKARSGHMLPNISPALWKTVGVSRHEFAHNSMHAPHLGLGNAVFGKYFHGAYSWNQTTKYARINGLANGFERWFQGWMEITYDLNESNVTAATTYSLRDFVDYDETIRIKLPYTEDQFIWLENHANTTNSFYKRIPWTIDGDGNAIPMQAKGLYGYVEKINPDRNDFGLYNSRTNILINGANGIKVIHGNGNYDYEFDGYYPRSYYNGFDVLKVNQKEANAFLGHHLASGYRHDFGVATSEQVGEIGYDNDYNTGTGDTSTPANEFGFIHEVGNDVEWGFLGNDMELPFQKMSAFTNPALINFHNKDQSVSFDRLSPTILHSLSVTHLASATPGVTDVRVDYDDGHIEDDFRMTGNVWLPTGENIFLNAARELLINRTATPNLQYAVKGSFYGYSYFIAAENSVLTLEYNSSVILDEGTTMVFNADSKLTMQADSKIYVRNGSLLCIKEDAIMNLNLSAKIFVENGTLQVDPGIDISANVIYTDDYVADTQFYASLDYCAVTSSPEHLHSTDGTYVNGTSCSGLGLTINATQKVKLSSEEFIEINGTFEVLEGGYFVTEILYMANDCDKAFYFEGGSPPTNGSGAAVKSIKDRTSDFDEPPFNVAVVPNPSNGVFDVIIDTQLGAIEYQLYNLQGTLLLENNRSDSSSFSISRHDLDKGIYLLRITSAEGVVTTKVIVN